MNEHPEFGTLLIGIIAFLSGVTLLADFLRGRHGRDGTNVVIETLMARISAWWAIFVLLSLASLAGRAGIVILFALVSFAALREFLTLTAKRRADHWVFIASFFVVLPAQYLLVYLNLYGLYAIFIPVYAFLFLPIIAVAKGDTDRFLARVAETQWGLMIAVFSASHVPALLWLDIPGFEGREVLLIAFLVIVVQGADVMNYVWGTLFGRRRIIENLPSSRTWEGAGGGLVSGVVLGAGLWWITPFSPLAAAGLALLVTGLGFAGHLVMKAIKQDKGVRDWGHLIPGQGGFIDRLDAVLFSVPVFFHVVRYTWSVG